MKQKTKVAKKLIGYDNNAPTAWYSLFFLIAAVSSFIQFSYVDHVLAAMEPVVHYDAKADDARIEKLKLEAERQLFLEELGACESSGDDMAKGDGGDSNGRYQVQKTTLESWLGRKVSYSEYYSTVTNESTIRPLVYEAYFERGESWRWKICTKKVTAQRAWKL